MKKHIIPFFATILFGANAIAQDNVGIGTLNPNTKAILDLTSNNKGLLAPRLTTAQRLAIAPTATEEALLVFDTDLKFYFYWDGTQWVQFPGNDADSDPTNELITNVVFDGNGNILTIEEGGNTWSTVINTNDADSDPTNELITNVTFNANGNVLTIEEGGNTFTTTLNIDINDADSDPTNELQTLTLSGNTLSISQGNSVDLTNFTNTDEQTLSLNGNILSISNGNSVTLPADNDSDPTNELNTGFNFNSGTNTLSITDAGGTLSVNLATLNNAYTAGAGISISGNVITNTGDLSNTNELITGLTFNTTTNVLTITDAGGSYTANFSNLGNDWKLTGNAGTNVSNNYLGTSDNVGLSIRTNATERIRITPTGLVGIGIVPAYPLDVLNQARLTRANTSLTVANQSQLELFNGGAGDVYISFHKSGVWGAHFGLDATNWFSTQGWSPGGGLGFTNLRTGSLQVNGTIQITGGGPQAGFILQSNDAAGNATWVSPNTVVNNVNNSNNYNILPTGSYVGMCVRNTNDGCCNCNRKLMAPITGWGTGCPSGYSFEQIAARWNGLNEGWVYACIKN